MGTQWECPICKSDNLEYWTVEFYDNQCYFPRECQKCWASWEEWYSMDFIWHENLLDKEWNKIGEDDEDF